MDNHSFDKFVRSLASGANRRQILKGLLGLGGAAVAGTAFSDTEAARRPTPTPRAISCPGQQTWNETANACVCPVDTTNCGPDCCPVGQAECCDNACCYGTCYGEELCCPTGRDFCAITGECCPEGWNCSPDYGCLSPEQCHTSEDCTAEICTNVSCTSEHVCGEPVMDCTNGGADACCSEGQVCLDDGTCCTPVCDQYDGRADSCGGTCDCPTGRDFCAITGECCPEGWSCSPDYGCFAPEQCLTSEDCTTEICTSVSCTPEYVCDEPVMDCTNGGAEVCCSDVEVCLDDGVCGCPPGQPVVNGACLWSHSHCTFLGACSTLPVGGLAGSWCLDKRRFVGACTTHADCPTGTVCSPLASGNPATPNLCAYPCKTD